MEIVDGAIDGAGSIVFELPIALDASSCAAHALRVAHRQQWFLAPSQPSKNWNDFQSSVNERITDSMAAKDDGADRAEQEEAGDPIDLRSQSSAGGDGEQDGAFGLGSLTSSQISAGRRGANIGAAVESGAFEAVVLAVLSVIDPILSDQLHLFSTQQEIASPLMEIIGAGAVAAALDQLDGIETDLLDITVQANGASSGPGLSSVPGPAVATAAVEVAQTISSDFGASDFFDSWQQLEAVVQEFGPEVVKAATLEETKPDPMSHGALQVEGTVFHIRLLTGEVSEIAPDMDQAFSPVALSATLGGAGAATAAGRNGASAIARQAGTAAVLVGLAAEAGKAMAPDRTIMTFEIREPSSGATVYVDAHHIGMGLGGTARATLRPSGVVEIVTYEPQTLGQIMASGLSVRDGIGTFELVLDDVIAATGGPYGLPGPARVDLSSTGLGRGTVSLGGGVGALVPAGATACWDIERPDRIAEAQEALVAVATSLVGSMLAAGHDALDDLFDATDDAGQAGPTTADVMAADVIEDSSGQDDGADIAHPDPDPVDGGVNGPMPESDDGPSDDIAESDTPESTDDDPEAFEDHAAEHDQSDGVEDL